MSEKCQEPTFGLDELGRLVGNRWLPQTTAARGRFAYERLLASHRV
jgi:hypothetical protein